MNTINIQEMHEFANACIDLTTKNPEIQFVTSSNIYNLIPKIKFVDFWSKNKTLQELFLLSEWGFNKYVDYGISSEFNFVEAWQLVKTFCILKIKVEEINENNFFINDKEAQLMCKVYSFINKKMDVISAEKESEAFLKAIKKPTCYFLHKVKNTKLFERTQAHFVIYCNNFKWKQMSDFKDNWINTKITLCESFLNLEKASLSNYSPLDKIYLTENQTILLELLAIIIQVEGCQKHLDVLFKKFNLSDDLLKEIKHLAKHHTLTYALNDLGDNNAEIKKINKFLNENKKHYVQNYQDPKLFLSIKSFINWFIDNMKDVYFKKLFTFDNKDQFEYEISSFVQKLKTICDKKNIEKPKDFYQLIRVFYWKCNSIVSQNKYLSFQNEETWKYYDPGEIKLLNS